MLEYRLSEDYTLINGVAFNWNQPSPKARRLAAERRAKEMGAPLHVFDTLQATGAVDGVVVWDADRVWTADDLTEASKRMNRLHETMTFRPGTHTGTVITPNVAEYWRLMFHRIENSADGVRMLANVRDSVSINAHCMTLLDQYGQGLSPAQQRAAGNASRYWLAKNRAMVATLLVCSDAIKEAAPDFKLALAANAYIATKAQVDAAKKRVDDAISARGEWVVKPADAALVIHARMLLQQ